MRMERSPVRVYIDYLDDDWVPRTEGLPALLSVDEFNLFNLNNY